MKFALHAPLAGTLLSLATLQLAAADAPAGGPVDFNRDIRPLFARHCTACHGGVKAAGKISFVYRDKALASGKSGKAAIVPHNPEASEVIQRVTTSDLDDLMPKPEHGPRLTPTEVDLLTRWIREGAKWSEHWAFVSIQNPPPPIVRDAGWPRTSIDNFIQARLEAEGLQHAPPAPPQEWLRRVSLDLTGIPPTIPEYTAFVQDLQVSPEAARAKVVDRLLASPRFGERWAAMWLDLARYSDTFGFEKDPHRDIWPWRDWVVRAFNADMPFDAFTLRQLAGDLLEHPTSDDLLATAFHRNTQNNTEGGTDDEEYRMAAVLDRVNTTWTTWQATTFGCTQCHSHPYDPIPHADYYRFVAFFNNTEDCDQNDDFPRLLFPKQSTEAAGPIPSQLELRDRRQRLQSEGQTAVQAVSDWKPWVPASATSSGGTLTVQAQGRVDASGTIPVSATYKLSGVVPAGTTALRLRILPDSSDPKRAPERGQAFSKLSVAYRVPGGSNQPVALREFVPDYLAGPYEPTKVIEGGSGFGSYPVMSGPREGVVVFQKPLNLPPDAVIEVAIEHGIAANSGVQGCYLRHFSLETTTRESLTEFANAPERVKAWEAWRKLAGSLKESEGVRVPIMAERGDPATRETRVFIRGNRLVLDDAVSPGVPDILKPKQPTVFSNRLDMARWLVSPDNPLTARVWANRLWAEMFGHGIVETLEDFGATGAKPSHPELLDHLAARLKGEMGWSMKQFLRQIALSATYGQSHRVPPELRERDPRNALLARGPRNRLSAEMVRDHSLAVAGLLATKAYGPPVYPPQPDGIWNTVYSSARWETSTGDDRYRRALYTYGRRTSGYPVFLTFDAPTRDGCVARRIPSNTPLQALTTWNDPAFLEAAQALAQRMHREGGSIGEQIRRGCRLITLEEPPASMLRPLEELYRQSLADYQSTPEASAKLGASPELAALTLVANTLLNLDSSLTR